MKIAWIGTGVMGKPMALHLKNGGHEIKAYNRSSEKADALEEFGITPCKTIEECVKDAEFVFTIVGFPKDVEEVYFSPEGILAFAKEGAVAIDMTTSSPELAKRIYEEGKKKNIHTIDAPVSGGDSGAKAGTLSIMAGGDKEGFEKALPLFELMGKNIIYMGGPGCGQHTKAANQIAIAGAVAAMTEAIYYAEENGLDIESMLNAIKNGAAGSWQLMNTAPRVLNGDFDPGFFIKHFIKDMNIIKSVMAEKGKELTMLNSVCSLYEALMEKGHGDEGTQALIKYYRG